MKEEHIKEQIKNILGESYKKAGLTEEQMIELFKEVYEEVQKENVHKKVLNYLNQNKKNI